jgi:AcrR family transcriptional regulator
MAAKLVKSSRRRVGRPRAAKVNSKEGTRHEIMAAAARLFSRHGYGGTQLNHIAAEAGLRTPSIYYYFSGKEEIRSALSSYAVDGSAAFAVDKVNEGGRAVISLYNMLLSHIARLTSGPYDLWFLIDASGRSRPVPSAGVSPYSKWKRAVMALIHHGISQGDLLENDIDFAMHMIIGCVHGAMELRHRNKPIRSEEIADFIIRALALDSTRAEEICSAAKKFNTAPST